MFSKPPCPCCFQSYAAGLLDDLSSGAASSAAAGDLYDALPPFAALCGTCTPSDVERALASKPLRGDASIPPIAFPLTPDEVRARTAKVLSDAEANLDAVASVPPSDVTFDNTVGRLMSAPNFKTNPDVAAAKFLQHCSTDPAVREAATEAGRTLSAARVGGRMRRDVYEKVRAFASTPEYHALDAYRRHFVDSSLKDFERAGLALNDEDASLLRNLLEEDSAVCAEYKTNLGDDATRLFFRPEELDGLPDDFVAERMERARRAGIDDGTCLVTLKYPDILPIGQTCAVAETRRRLVRTREGPDGAFGANLDLVARGAVLRKRVASLLGFESWAEYVLQRRMSGSYAAVDDFLSSLEEKLAGPAREDYAKLLRLKEEHCVERGVDFDGKLNAWDQGYYDNLMLKREYGVDTQAIRAYFPLDHVVSTTLELYQELLGLTFAELTPGTFWSWHRDVRCFDVRDASSNSRIGFFYLDLHPREGKYGHAAIFHLVKRTEKYAAVDCMLCNLPARGSDGKPALLTHRNVVTFFHEFGHIMHALCSEGVGNMTRLAKCPRDFVEAPSQMLENWCWQREVLGKLSRHHETGESLPEDLLASMLRAKHVNVALSSLRSIYLGRLDLAMHGPDPPEDAAGLQRLVDDLRPRLSLVDNPPGNNMLRTFAHLMNQYSASYYGYMWAEVLSADMFATRFEKEGAMNPEVGMQYRKLVLAPGGTHDINDHLTKFLGRPPNNEAFLRSRGIIS